MPHHLQLHSDQLSDTMQKEWMLEHVSDDASCLYALAGMFPFQVRRHELVEDYVLLHLGHVVLMMFQTVKRLRLSVVFGEFTKIHAWHAVSKAMRFR